MKVFDFLQIIVLVVVFSSCQKESDPAVSYQPNFKAEKNSTTWVSTNSWATYSPKEKMFYINASKSDSKYDREEVLSIAFSISDFSDSATTTNFSSEWYSIIGGDAIADRYILDGSSSENQVQITSVNTEKQIITGKFSVRLVRDSWYSTKGESFEFRSGTFSINYSEIE